MFHNVLMTSLTPLRNTDEINNWQNRPFTTIWPEQNYQDLASTAKPVYQPKNTEVTKTIKKRTKRIRTAYTTDQLQVLERTYMRIKYVSADKRKQLAESLQITEKSIKVWFQNRRMKEKRESSESSDSSQEVTTTGMPSPPLSLPCMSPKEPDYPKVESNQFNNHVDVETSPYELPNFNFSNQTEYPTITPSVMPSTEPFADDRSIYPTYYYPTLENYYLGDSYRYDCGNTYYTDAEWSATNFDLNYFQ